MKQLEIRFYTREEIAEILNIDIKSSHFARDTKNILDNWGYEYNYSRKGVEIIKVPATAAEKLAEIIIREYGMDIKVDTYAFACFIAAFNQIDNFDAMPWSERELMMKDTYDVSVSERTLRNWCSKLIETGTIAKSQEKIHWRTICLNGKKERELIHGDEEAEAERIAYWTLYNQERNKYIQKSLESFRKDYKQINAEAGKVAQAAAWSNFGCCYYSCKVLSLAAFDEGKLETLQEVYELVNELTL